MVSILGALALDFFIIPPYLKFSMGDTKYFLTFAGVSAVGLIINTLASQTKKQAIEAKEKEERTALLYRLSKDLAASDSLDSVLEAIRKNVGQIFDCDVAVFLPIEDKFQPGIFDPSFPVTEHEEMFAAWVFENDKPAGIGTHVFMESRAHYFPLKTSQGMCGVLGVAFKNHKDIPVFKEGDLLSALANQAAIGLQRAKQAEISRQLALMHDKEKLQAALLNSISHDLRTPLVSIKGALSSLLEDSGSLNPEIRKELITTAYEDSDHLNRIVGNLLDITRLEAQALITHIKPCELRDVIGAALQALKNKIESRNIIIDIPKNLPEVSMDFVLMMRVFINLVDNAVKYSQSHLPIGITVELKEKHVQVDIKDSGYGIPQSDLTKIFDKFYRTSQTRQITGTGLGLSICKGIVEAHGGRIWAENNVDQGAVLRVELPLKKYED